MSFRGRQKFGRQDTKSAGRIVSRYAEARIGELMGNNAFPAGTLIPAENTNENNGEGYYWIIGIIVPAPVRGGSSRARRKVIRNGGSAPRSARIARTRVSVAGLALASGLLLASCWAQPAAADPCRAIPDRGPMPAHLAPGRTFRGPVAYVGDGDGLCVALGRDPGRWAEVRLADFYAPELSEPGGWRAREQLARMVMGRVVVCLAGRRSYDRVVARCTLDGVSIGDRLRALGVAEGGRGRR